MKYYLVIILFLLCSGCIFSQKKNGGDVYTLRPDTLFVIKQKCHCEFDGYALQIKETKLNLTQKECGDFTYDLLYTASIEQKISLIEQLMQFENDTTLSCTKVRSYNSNSKKYIDNIISNRYSLQIYALFHINLICFGENAPFRYSPFPVLIDVESNREINFDTQSVSEVFQIYKEWFEKAKKSGFNNYTFPLFDTKYRWKFGDYSKKITFEKLPEIRSDFKSRIGRPY